MDFSKLKVVEDKNRKPVDEPPFYKEVIFKGEELVGLEYEPPFDFFEGKIANAHKVLDGDFVTTEDGTGIVHIASGFGEDDFNLCKKNGIGVVCPVDDGGCFCLDAEDEDVKYKLGDREEVLHLNGRQVFETNDDIIKYLKGKDLWVKTEQYLHNYPHCWRTDTPLIYKAVSSWYVKVSDFKDRMCELNKQIHWIPEHVRDGQFGKWLENARDWSITRNRFWGAPVPVWRGEYKIVTSGFYGYCFEENTEGYMKEKKVADTFFGVEKKRLHKQACFDLKHLFFKKNGDLLIEINGKVVNNEDELSNCIEDYLFNDGLKMTHYSQTMNHECKTGEPFAVYNCYLEANFSIKIIPSSIEALEYFKDDYLEDSRNGANSKKYINHRGSFEINDLHRPYIDELVKYIPCKEQVEFYNELYTQSMYDRMFFGGMGADGDPKKHIKICAKESAKKIEIRRVDDVLDCWFESGSMPYAQVHYPFEYRDGNGNLIRTAEENKKWFDTHFPCDFVTEYVAQTRGWFYTMVVLATALFDKIPFKNVICHGVMLDKDGQKLSKRLRNYPDPLEMIDIYGSDAMRWLMASSPVVQGGDMRIDKDGKMIADVVKNVLNPIWNAFVFYKQYAELDEIKITGKIDTENVMDKYILSKLKLFVEAFEKAMDGYNTIDACHEVELFIDALNNWYIRRNKERFWKKEHDADKQQAYEVLHFVLKTFATATAPILPFLCEEIYQEVSKFEGK